eukprot:PLAT2651.2.p1 GENE.PLAT2651.2~~PLAT2651.2.p1  ORF type:complete len:398 (+),score=229.45 PLAT2651.2:282-1475(+)
MSGQDSAMRSEQLAAALRAGSGDGEDDDTDDEDAAASRYRRPALITALALHILVEDELGADSDWAPLLASFPRRIPNALDMTAEQSELLRASNVLRRADDLQGVVARLYNSTVLPLVEDGLLAPAAAFTPARFRWAVSIAWAYGTLLPTGDDSGGAVPILAPLLALGDGIVAAANAVLIVDDSSAAAAIAVNCTASLAAPARIVLPRSFSHSNLLRFLHAGYVLPEDAGAHSVLLWWQLLTADSDRLRERKTQLILRFTGRRPSKSGAWGFLLLHETVDPQLLLFLRVTFMTEEQVSDAEQHWTQEEALDELVSADNERYVALGIKQMAAHVLDRYELTADELADKIERCDDDAERAALQLQAGEIAVLQSNIAVAEARLAGMADAERGGAKNKDEL